MNIEERNSRTKEFPNIESCKDAGSKPKATPWVRDVYLFAQALQGRRKNGARERSPALAGLEDRRDS